MESTLIFGLPRIFGLLPLILYIILTLKGKNLTLVVLISTALGAILNGVDPVSLGNTIFESMGSFMALIGIVVMLGSGLGEVLKQTGVAKTLVNLIVVKSVVKSQRQAIIAVMATSSILVGLLTTLSGSNIIIAPIVIPILASLHITPSTLGIILHGAGITGCMLGPFSPHVITYMELTGLTYLQYLKSAGIPIAIIMWVSTYFNAMKTQRETQGNEYFSEEEVAGVGDEIGVDAKRATIVFLLTMLVLITYGIISQGGAPFVIIVILVATFTTGLAAKYSPSTIMEHFIKGGSRMFSMFLMFLLYDPFIKYITMSGAFDAIVEIASPFMTRFGPTGFLLMSTTIGIFAIFGAIVAQARVIDDMFKPMVVSMGIPMEIWALVLMIGSQITSFVYPTEDIVIHMSLAHSRNLKAMIRNGICITIMCLIYLFIRSLFI